VTRNTVELFPYAITLTDLRTTAHIRFLIVRTIHSYWSSFYHCIIVQGRPKSMPLPNYKKIMLNRIKVCQWD